MNTDDILRERYRIQSVIGRGGMGCAYKALDLETQSTVAIKQLQLSHLPDWKMLELFEREAKVLQHLDHPNIPDYIEYFSTESETDAQFFLVQEYIEGRSLQQMIEEGWRASEEGILNIFMKLVDILEYLHTLHPPVIHRDITPQNIILSQKKTSESAEEFDVFLVDFGAVQDHIRTTLYGGATTVGTYGYVPLEQFNGRAVPASDYYALGATLLFMLSHRHPADFETENLRPKFRESVKVSQKLARLLDGLLEASVEKRLASKDAIEAVLSQKSAITPQSSHTPALPYGTKIQKLQKSPGHIQLNIPGKFSAGSIFMLGFATFWLAFIAFWTVGALSGGLLFALFSIPFWIVGFGMFGAALYMTFGRTLLDLTPEWVQIRYTFFGLKYSRRVPSASVNKVSREQFYKQNDQPVRGISLYAGAKILKFGSQLTPAEQDWIVHEIESYVLEHASS